jgi:hypothetical protein
VYGSLAMGRPRYGELSASTAAVLGLLIEEPDGPKGLEDRLRERFASALWSYSTAHNALKSLKGQGYVRISGSSSVAGESDKNVGEETLLPSRPDISALLGPKFGYRHAGRAVEEEDLYQPTSQGIDVFWRWLRSSTSVSAIREDLRTKIAFSRPEHTPLLITMIKLEEDECKRQYEALHASLAPLEERIGDDAFVSEQEWSTLMTITLIRDEATIWFARMQQRERLREYIEELRDEATRRTLIGRQQRSR